MSSWHAPSMKFTTIHLQHPALCDECPNTDAQECITVTQGSATTLGTYIMCHRHTVQL